ncbi:hypothetical protein DB347_24450 [Opitutaceae bacterium EW11]|nr:hypothetical protein DB347_24450 [Opitutaceae bacterium EW11]
MPEISELISRLGLDPSECIVLSSGGSQIDFTYEVSPYQFLSQAASDLHTGGTAALLNSLTNSRRAILCQMDRVLEALGFDAHSLSTKAKTELLAFLGLPTPAILRKVGDLRNDLEHRYKSPPLDRVEDAHDIAMLFIEAIDRYMDTFWGEFYIGQKDELLGGMEFGFKRQLEFDYDSERRVFRVVAAQGSEHFPMEESGRIGRVPIDRGTVLHKHCVRLALTEFSRIPAEEAVQDFFVALKDA